MRAIWTGALSFGLVNIPVRLYSATAGTELKFNLLHQKDLSPIKYLRVCRADGAEVPYEDIVKGYEYQKGDYVVLTDEDFKRANVRRTKTIDISEFVDEKEIDLIYAEKPYYLEPDRGAAKPYVLLREALKRSGKVAVCKFVLRQKEHLGIVKPHGNVLLLEQLRFATEIREPEGIDAPTDEVVGDKEVEVALALINQLSEPFNPSEHEDEYTKELLGVIEEKSKGKTVRIQEGEEPAPTAATDLMATLRASLERASTGK
jgi:DNA end-binding protein Ku